MFAVILNMNPENLFSSGLMSRSTACVGRGHGAISTKQFNISWTPKLFSAEPKNTGAILPSRYPSLSNSEYTPSISSRSERNFSAKGVPMCLSSSSVFISISTFSVTICLDGWKRLRLFSYILYTPLNLAPWSIGQERGRTEMESSSSNSSSRSKGSLPSRSILLTKMITGVFLIRQTSMSFLVCDSTPFAPSTTMITLSTAVNVRYVSSAKSWWPGVSRILIL